MHLGITMFPTEYAIAPHELAREVEARGFESLWFPEHTHIPASRQTPYPGGPELPQEYWHTLDPFGSLCAAAAVTKTIKLATGICLLIERDTIVTAKEAATVDRISGGRFLFGVGGGWNVEEMANHGTAFATRFKKLKEQVAAVRAIWTQREAEYHGEFVRFDKIWCDPKPLQQPGPPVIVGGFTQQAIARAADYGDGWLPIGAFGADALRPGLAELDRQLAAKARDRKKFSVSVYAAPPKAEELAKFRDLGVDRAIFLLRPEGREQTLSRLDKLAQLMIGA